MIDVVRIERAAFAMFRICDFSRYYRLVTAVRTLRGTRFSEVVMLYSICACRNYPFVLRPKTNLQAPG